MSEEEFVERFVKRIVEAAGDGTFEDGEPIADYARNTAVTYFETPWQREMGPEECADADLSYWGE